MPRTSPIHSCLAAVLASGILFADSAPAQQPAINGSAENNNGQLRVIIENQAESAFSGIIRLSAGSDSDQRDLGQAEFDVPGRATRIFRCSPAAATGSHYTLAIYDSRGRLIFFKFAPLPRVSDPSPDVTLSLLAVSPGRKAQVASPPPTVSPSAPSRPDGPPPETGGEDEVHVVTRLMAGDGEKETFLLSFELTARIPVNDATMSISVGKHRDSKPVSISQTSLLEFKLPEQINRETKDTIDYRLTSKEGRLLARGTLTIPELMTDDYVSVIDVIPGQEEYEPGESAKITLFMEGSSAAGYRVEILIKDSGGLILLRDQRQSGKIEQPQFFEEFNFQIPDNARGPLSVIFKAFNPSSGLMYDSGEREIALKRKGS